MAISSSLYVIGNGFDIHHGIQSKYWQFGEYVKLHNSELYDTFEDFFSFEGNWDSFEETLKYIDVDYLVDSASDFLVSYGADDWSDSYHHDYQYEIDRVVSALSVELKNEFVSWILQLNIPNSTDYQDSLLPIDKNALFLNFNYTPTLQKLYSIPDNQILHIHNQAIDTNSNLILGHGWNPDTRKSLNDIPDIEDQDTRITEGNSIIDSYFKKTFKPTAEIIKLNSDFFDCLGSIKFLNVLGHGLADVDYPYFEELTKYLDLRNTKWKISYYSNDSLISFQKTIQKLGVKEEQVEFISLQDFKP